MNSKVALFQLAGEGHSMLLAAIDQILLLPSIFRLPLLPKHFAGVFLNKGELIPLLTPGCVAGAADGRDASSAGYVLVCRTEFGLVGLPADRVLRIVEQAAGTLEVAGQEGDESSFFYFQGERYPLWKPETLIGLPRGPHV